MKNLLIAFFVLGSFSSMAQTRTIELERGQSVDVNCKSGLPKLVENNRGASIRCISLCQGTVNYSTWGLKGEYIAGRNQWGQEIRVQVGPTSNYSGVSDAQIQREIDLRVRLLGDKMRQDLRCDDQVIDVVNEQF